MGFLEFLTGSQPPLIKGALGDFCVMMNVSRNMSAMALAGLLDNEIPDHELEAQQVEVNYREAALCRAVLEPLNVDPKSELVLALKLLSVSQEVQPLGCVAVSMGRMAVRLGAPIDILRSSRNRVLPQFDRVRDSFVDAGSELAERVAVDLRGAYSDLVQFVEDLSAVNDVANVEAAFGMQRACTHLSLITGTLAYPFHRIRVAVTHSSTD